MEMLQPISRKAVLYFAPSLQVMLNVSIQSAYTAMGVANFQYAWLSKNLPQYSRNFPDCQSVKNLCLEILALYSSCLSTYVHISQLTDGKRDSKNFWQMCAHTPPTAGTKHFVDCYQLQCMIVFSGKHTPCTHA